MTTISEKTWQINGVLSTDKTVWQNIQTLASAAGCFISFDTASSKWSIVINKPSSSVKSFDDNNIVGSIVVSGTGLSEMYNRVQIEFPHKDMLDNRDTIMDQIPLEDFYPNEPDKLLNLTYDIINDPVQAEMIALMELKQSRLDKVVQFRTDFTSIGLRAGDVIDITSDMYGFQSKLFRIIMIEESDEADGSILLSITALEYDSSIYDFSDVARYHRDSNTGIVNSSSNLALSANDKSAGGANVVTIGISTSELNHAFAVYTGGGVHVATLSGGTDQYVDRWISGSPNNPPADPDAFLLTYFYLPSSIKCMLFTLQNPVGSFNYKFASPTTTAVNTRSNIIAYFPMQVNLQYLGEDGSSPPRELQANTADWQTQTMNFQVNDAPTGVYRFVIFPLYTYDLNQKLLYNIYPYGYSAWPNSNGDAITINGYSFYK